MDERKGPEPYCTNLSPKASCSISNSVSNIDYVIKIDTVLILHLWTHHAIYCCSHCITLQ